MLLYSVRKGTPHLKDITAHPGATPMSRPSHPQTPNRLTESSVAPASSIRIPARGNVAARQQQSLIAHANRMRNKRHSAGNSLDGPSTAKNRFGTQSPPPSTLGYLRPTRSSAARSRQESASLKRQHSISHHEPNRDQPNNPSSVGVVAEPLGGDEHQSLATNEITCDYDNSATILYELLEASSWDDAIVRCRECPEEARTWIIRKDKSHKVRWKLLPLHAAIIFQAPTSVVTSLLDQYRSATRRKDDQGMLPLHLAFRHKQEDEGLLESLLREFPIAVVSKDKRDRIPLEHGRDLKFSAKIMRVYADAYLDAMGAKSSDRNVATASPRVGSFRRDTPRSDGGEIQHLRQKHKEDLQRLQNQYEEKLSTMRERIEHEAQHAKLIAADERENLVDRHNEEIAELRDMLSTQAGRENSLMQDLQAQIDDLQTALENAESQNESWAERYRKIESYNSELRLQLQRTIQDQLFIRDLAHRQSKELDSARKSRQMIIQSLMQQEDTDRHNDQARAAKLGELAEAARARVQSLIDNDQERENDSRGLSRIEWERNERGEHNDNAKSKLGEEAEGRDDVVDRMGEIQITDDQIEVREAQSIGGDEISAITEHSP